MGRVDGRVVIVTGAARGLGAATSRLLASEGARVLVTDVLEEPGEGVAGEISAAGGVAAFQPLDVTDPDAWDAAVARAEAEWGKLDGLVNNAGLIGAGPLEECTLEDYDRVIAVTQTGVFLGMRHAMPAFRRAGGGAIVNISSTSGIAPLPGSNGGPSYPAAKAAVRLMTKSVACDYASQNVRVNSVHPGSFESDMSGLLTGPLVERMLHDTPMGRKAHPEEIAHGVLWLLSDDASYVTGAELCIDGGYTAH